jgi:hypothetical protein
MTFQIIIRRPGKWRGKNITELGKNLESIGWPSEFKNEGERDRVAFEERKLGRPITKSELKKIK